MFTETEGIIFHVTDLEPGRDFYGRILQLPIIRESDDRITFHIPQGRLVLTLDSNGAHPCLKYKSNLDSPGGFKADSNDAKPSPGHATFVLLVEDVDTAAFYLNRQGVAFLTPIEARGGLWICEIFDPYGNRIGIAQLNELRK